MTMYVYIRQDRCPLPRAWSGHRCLQVAFVRDIPLLLCSGPDHKKTGLKFMPACPAREYARSTQARRSSIPFFAKADHRPTLYVARKGVSRVRTGEALHTLCDKLNTRQIVGSELWCSHLTRFRSLSRLL